MGSFGLVSTVWGRRAAVTRSPLPTSELNLSDLIGHEVNNRAPYSRDLPEIP